MAITEGSSTVSRRPSWLLARLFDEAWLHGRKRRNRAAAFLLLAIAVTAAVIASQIGGERSTASGRGVGLAGVGGRYVVCASNAEGLWVYTYGTRCAAAPARTRDPYSYHDLVVPARSLVRLTVARTATDHTLRIPGLGVALHANTQGTAQAIFRTPRPGEYSGTCSAGCGQDRQFAAGTVFVLNAAHYKTWLATQAAAITEQSDQTSHLRRELTQLGVLARTASQ